MRIMLKIFFLPFYLIILLASVVADIIKQTFSYVCGFLFLIILMCLAVTIINQAWKQTLLLIVLMLIGYGILFGVVTARVLIEELKEICYRKML